jgi:hypothetical protein
LEFQHPLLQLGSNAASRCYILRAAENSTSRLL